MPKFSVDLNAVSEKLSKKSFKLNDVKDKIEKVAFDVVRFVDGKSDELWKIQDSDEGQYIVALYDYSDESDKVATASISSKWTVLDKDDSLHFFYNQEYIAKVAASSLGFSNEDIVLAKRYLPTRLTENKELSSSLIKMMDKNAAANIISKYPELA